MKNIALVLGAAALVIPAAAHATHNGKSKDGTHYTYQKVDVESDNTGEYRIEKLSEEDFDNAGNTKRRSGSYNIMDGEKLVVKGNTVYKITANGQSFYAPNGSYAISGHRTIVVDDGQLVRIERAPEIVKFD